MKGCPHCTDFKEILTNEGIEFVDRDVDDFKDEYELFSEITDSDLIPALLIIEGNEENNKSYFYVPDEDYDELTEAVEIINYHRSKIL
jgi:glutaredoxin